MIPFGFTAADGIRQLSVFVDMNVSESTPFFRFGPSSRYLWACSMGVFGGAVTPSTCSLMFFHTPIDTYSKYNALVTLIVFHVVITDVLSDSLTPNLVNTAEL